MLTQSQKQKIKKYFADQPVDVVYLFGSQATGKVTALSDYDFAVLFKEDVDKGKRFDLKLKYMRDLGTILKTEKVEVLDLNQAPLFFRYSAFAPRQDLLVKDELKRIEFEQRSMSEYFDRLYYLKRHTRYSLAHIAEKGFDLHE